MKGNFKVYFIVAAIVLGITFEVLKSINVDSFQQPTQQGISAKELRDLNDQAFHRTDGSTTRTGIESRKQRLGEFLANNPKYPENHSFTEGKKTKDDKKVTKKQIKKKKKKEDKKDGAPDVETELEVAKVEPNEDENKEDENPGPVYPTFGAGGVSPPQEENLGIPVSFEDWEKLVIERASFKNTSKLIKYFQQNIVEPAVFHDVVDSMVASDNPEVKKQGVRAASVTPSVRSFLALSLAIQTEDSDSEIRKIATTAINRSYHQVSNLDVLRTVLSSNSNRFAVLLATQALDESIKKNLRVSNDDGVINPNSQDNTPSKSAIKKYQPFYIILSNLVNNSQDSDISRRARDVLDDLTELISLAEA